MTSMPHSEFLNDIQTWVWRRFPTRQMSATDIFYALQWAESGVPCVIFVEGFELWLKSHPHEFVKNGSLSTLHFEADRIIQSYRQQHVEPAQILYVEDPYEKALQRIAELGKKTTNPLLRDQLRIFYQNMLNSRSENRKAYPEWHLRSESYYPLKAHAILDWDESLQHLLDTCFSYLSPEEQAKLSSLSHEDQLHCMLISEDAQKIYKTRILNQKIAAYFEISPLLENL